jgi:hypothetical protein
VEVEEHHQVNSQIGLQLRKTLVVVVVVVVVCTSVGLGKVLENTEPSNTESLGYYELKQHKPWFDEECSELLDQRKQAKLQWL